MDNRVEIFLTSDKQIQVHVQFNHKTMWLSQKNRAKLFDNNSDTIGLHLKNIYQEEELEEAATAEFFSVVQQEGKRRES